MNPQQKIFVIAGTSSGVGKTTITVGLIAALRKRGLVVQPFKCGPDYIDADYHSIAAGRPCRNLDSWMLDDAQVQASFRRACVGADVAIIEGVMGLFDGSDFTDERASAAQIAKLLNAPVVLVTDISGAARSVAATVTGFAQFDPELRLGATIFNFAGSEAHAKGCQAAVEKYTEIPVLGWMPRDEKLRVPERHLGLATANEQHDISKLVTELGIAIEARVDLEKLLSQGSLQGQLPEAPSVSSTRTNARPVLAVARDEAFSFYYPDNLELLEDAGVQIAYFSPVKGERLPVNTAGVYLGGGYPEIHAPALAANTGLWSDLRALHSLGAPIWAECGGFMALTETLITLDGKHWPMAGLVPGIVTMTEGIAGLGYRLARSTSNNLLAEAGQTLRGHEFHYSVWNAPASTTAHTAWLATGTKPNSKAEPLGYAKNGLLASYLHIHLGQKPDLAQRLASRLSAVTTKSST